MLLCVTGCGNRGLNNAGEPHVQIDSHSYQALSRFGSLRHSQPRVCTRIHAVQAGCKGNTTTTVGWTQHQPYNSTNTASDHMETWLPWLAIWCQLDIHSLTCITSTFVGGGMLITKLHWQSG